MEVKKRDGDLRRGTSNDFYRMHRGSLIKESLPENSNHISVSVASSAGDIVVDQLDDNSKITIKANDVVQSKWTRKLNHRSDQIAHVIRSTQRN